ncbi:HugZ family protein [Actibacterium sp. 188UL27-1]|uniref:HugZ family pyridoxamine 5'-phosphate oxidase n=1 Tax=Actibacterium sp. 188UL27-1 TaxID=2786961 RepID=UPI00195C467E|nr:pyridoxamine 5'-phosphate oxidase family protein [Actibacterium sp. 188UL27-1]MBM7069349.1 pyridoxamine 5'-phosphate oxidase family protein [Actibacterium sp. 188UL27-1]
MPNPDPSPIRPTDDDARHLAQGLIRQTKYAALAVLMPETGAPMVSRIAFATTPDREPLTLISDLSAHTKALVHDPQCSILVGEPGERGDPLTHPRLTLQARATFIRKGARGHDALRAHYLSATPKATLYVDFADFAFVRFAVSEAYLNGGFGKAFHLTPTDLGL